VVASPDAVPKAAVASAPRRARRSPQHCRCPSRRWAAAATRPTCDAPTGNTHARPSARKTPQNERDTRANRRRSHRQRLRQHLANAGQGGQVQHPIGQPGGVGQPQRRSWAARTPTRPLARQHLPFIHHHARGTAPPTAPVTTADEELTGHCHTRTIPMVDRSTPSPQACSTKSTDGALTGNTSHQRTDVLDRTPRCATQRHGADRLPHPLPSPPRRPTHPLVECCTHTHASQAQQAPRCPPSPNHRLAASGTPTGSAARRLWADVGRRR